MASKSLLTYGSKVSNVEQVYYSPVVVVPTTGENLTSIYCLLSKVENWADDNNPPVPTQDQKSIKQLLNKTFAAKLITTNNITAVVKRIDWTVNTVYDYYRDDIDMFATDNNGFPLLNFYVKNRYDQVFKCLWNVNGSPSIVEPYFEPGSYGTNNIYQGIDGYKWKYIYTIDENLKVKFMDTTWIPVPVGSKTPNSYDSPFGSGSVDVINVINGGSGYDQTNTIITVTVTGDGIGAAATAVTTNNSISDIIVTTPGANYSYANVVISSSLGANAVAIAPVSPIGGHGYDPVSELGCRSVMITCEFNGAESGVIPTDIDYHQMALVINPVTKSSSPSPANGAVYKTSTDLVVAPGFGSYINDEVIYQGNSVENSSFSATVLSFDVGTNVIRTINTKGTLNLTTNSPVFGNSSKTVRTLLSYNTPEFVTSSGYVVYMENRSGIQRSADGIEQFKIVLQY